MDYYVSVLKIDYYKYSLFVTSAIVTVQMNHCELTSFIYTSTKSEKKIMSTAGLPNPLPPDINRASVVNGTAIGLLIPAVVAVIARVIVRRIWIKRMGWDDWLMIIATVLSPSLRPYSPHLQRTHADEMNDSHCLLQTKSCL